MTGPVTLTDDGDGVATVTLAQPALLNPLDEPVLDALEAALARVRPDDAVRVVRVVGEGRAFSAGGDLRSIYDKFGHEPEATGERAWELGYSRAEMDRQWVISLLDRWLRIWSFPKPVVAQVHGWCLGGGLDLIGSCDIVFAAEDARFGHPAIRAHGILPTFGQWPFRIGMLKAKELMFTGDPVSGREAARIGLVNEAVPAVRLEERVLGYCRRAAAVPLAALITAKRWTNRWFELAGLRTALSEGAEFDTVLHTDPAFDAFLAQAQAGGVKGALAWRDTPFRG